MNDPVQFAILSIASTQLEISRETLTIVHKNLEVNTATLQATLEKLEIEKSLLLAIEKLNTLLEEK